jgi:hypothetical protein
MDKQGLNAVQSLPNAYDSEFIGDNAQYYEGSFVSPVFVPFEKEGLPAEMDDFLAAMEESGKTVREITVFGWVLANQFVTGLELAGSQFDQQKLIDALNQVTSFSADGMIVPIDWTKQHNSADGRPEFEGDWECNSIVKIENGEFVPVYDEPESPWVCFEGGPEATELTTDPEYTTFEGMSLNE